MLDELASDFPRESAVPDDDARAQGRDWDAGICEYLLHLPAAAQVPGQLVVIVAQTTEIDDSPELGARRRTPEGASRGRIVFSKLALSSKCTR